MNIIMRVNEVLAGGWVTNVQACFSEWEKNPNCIRTWVHFMLKSDWNMLQGGRISCLVKTFRALWLCLDCCGVSMQSFSSRTDYMLWERPYSYWRQFQSLNVALRWKQTLVNELRPPPPHVASNSLTIVMPINLMTLWLFWIFFSSCWTPSICYGMCCCCCALGSEKGKEKLHSTVLKCT